MKLFAISRAAATGTTIRLDMIRVPTILVEMAIVIAVRNVISVFIKLTFTPSIRAEASSKEMRKRLLYKATKIEIITTPIIAIAITSAFVVAIMLPKRYEEKSVALLIKSR